MLFCHICSVRLSGPIDQQAHNAGRRHKENVAARQASQNRPSGSNTTRPIVNPQHSAARESARPATDISPRPQGLNATDSRQPHSASYARRGRGAARRPFGPRGGSVPRSASTRPPPPPSEPGTQPVGTRPPARPKKPAHNRTYHVDFKVIRNTEHTTTWESFDLIVPKHDGRPQVEIVPIKLSRRASVAGFSLGDINLLPSRKGYKIFFGFNPSRVGRGVHIVQAQIEYPIVGGSTVTTNLQLKAIVGSPEDHDSLQAAKPYEPIEREQIMDDWQRGPMLRNKPVQPTLDFGRLPFYDVPNDYWTRVQGFVDDNFYAKVHLQSHLPAQFETKTYANHWKNLLWHEEIAVCNKLKQYDMENVPIPRLPTGKHSLEVPGLEENRPSVIVSDLIAIRKPGQRRPVYGGYVTDLQRSSVILQLHDDFSSITGERWDARFTVNRLVFRRMHDAVAKACSDFDRVLFPKSSHQKPRGTPPRMSIAHRINTNSRQHLAVERIASMAPGDIPFVIFGPPGTGKTTVVVEAIHQVLTTQSEARLLVCAPSNSAADLLAIRLSTMYTPRQLLRLSAPSRSYDSLPITLRKYSSLDGRTFISPPKEDMIKFRIVVSSCYYASVPRALGIEKHFTHIFVDEAGHASEPEIMISILQNVSRETNVIFSGDPKQLGPIIQSRPCIELGMANSFLDRLTDLPVYQETSGAGGSNIIKLVQNYRSHSAILNFPNKVFYDGELEVCADPVITTIKRLDRARWLPRPGFPVVFHSVCGENQREGSSPSYFNIEEATLVRHYVKALLDGNEHGLNAKDIGIIAPYRQQCVKIRRLLNDYGYGGIDVKVTEDWQGQEKRVIIISTVRSDPELPEDDKLRFLGFVSNEKRTNVALTRAQALLIVIGFGPVLQLDPFWYGFIQYVHNSGGCTGDELFFTEKFNNQAFDEMRKANKDYMNQFDDRLWGALQSASAGWNPQTRH